MTNQVKIKSVKDVDAFEYFTISRETIDTILTVQYQTIELLGQSGIDYFETKGNIIFQENVSELTVMIPKLGDYTIDRSKDLSLELSVIKEEVPPPKIVTRYFELTQEILNNALSWLKDSSPDIIINNDLGVNLHFQTMNNSAISGSDYFETYGDVFFKSDVDSIKFPVDVYADSIAMNGDTFSMLVSVNDQVNIELIANYSL
jgi:hypothetical protein